MSFFLGHIYYALESPADGAIDLVTSWVRAEEDMPGYRVPQVTGGLLREQSIALFQAYVSLHPPGPMRAWAQTLASL
jgi:tRNA(adenine34) deaminase